MKITGKLTGDLVDVRVKRTKDGGSEATIDLEFSLKREEVTTLLGADFEAISFALMRIREDDEDGAASVGFLVKSVKPDERLFALELHALAVDGESFSAHPELRKVAGVNGEQRVLVTVRLPVEPSIAQKFVRKVGTTVPVDFAPSQAAFAFKARKAPTTEAMQ